MGIGTTLFGIRREYHDTIIKRWKRMGRPSLPALAPYAAYALTVEMFFQICIAADIISSDRVSNRTDIE